MTAERCVGCCQCSSGDRPPVSVPMGSSGAPSARQLSCNGSWRVVTCAARLPPSRLVRKSANSGTPGRVPRTPTTVRVDSMPGLRRSYRNEVPIAHVPSLVNGPPWRRASRRIGEERTVRVRQWISVARASIDFAAAAAMGAAVIFSTAIGAAELEPERSRSLARGAGLGNIVECTDGHVGHLDQFVRTSRRGRCSRARNRTCRGRGQSFRDQSP
jgi:hypothetical protein